MQTEAVATNGSTNSKRKRGLKVADGGSDGDTSKRTRKRREGGGAGKKAPTFVETLRANARTARAKLQKLVDAERKLEASLAVVRAEREAAEQPVRDVEEVLARYPELPSSAAAEVPPVEPNQGGEEVTP